MKILSASKLREDQLEAAIEALLFAKGAKVAPISAASKQRPT
jgi:hypothetical protein